MAPLIDMAAAACKNTRLISWKEFSDHERNDDSSIWICVENKVYDIAPWKSKHPGGIEVLKTISGKNATEIMQQFHKPESYVNRIKEFYVGDLVTTCVNTETKEGKSAFTVDMNNLEEYLKASGWYKPSFKYMLRKTLQVYILFALAWVCVVYGYSVENVYVQYIGAMIVGLVWQQSNFLGHDAGHSSVFEGDADSHLLYGLVVGPATTGISLAWWKHSHYTHHVMTNCITHDPDIQHLPVLAISEKFFKGIFSEFHQLKFPFDKVSRMFVSYQHWVYYPILTVSRFNMHAQSLVHVLMHPSAEKTRTYELVSLTIFWCWWVYMLSFLPSWGSLALFYYLTHVVVSLIHIQICLSHFWMETFNAEEQYQLQQASFFEYQLRTTLDIDCPKWLDWLHGGLQYQTAHHMFPRIPRNRLRALQGLIMKVCDKHGVKYHHYGFIEANIMTIKHMKKVAMSARAALL